MSPKKAKEKRTFTEAEEAIMTEDEREILEAEEEPTEEGKDNEPEGSEKDTEGKDKPKEPPEKKPGEGKEGKKPEGEGEKEGGEPKEPVEGEKVTIVVDGEEIEGAVAKSGNYIIPYSEVKKRDEKYGRVKTENESLRAEIAALKARQEKPPEPEKKEEKPPEEPDFEALEAKLYDQVDDVKSFLKNIYLEGQKAVKPPEEKPPEEKAEVPAETPEQIAKRVENTMALKQGVKAIVKEYPKLDEENENHDENAEYLFTQLGLKILGEKLKDMSEEEQVAWTGNVENLLATTKEAATKTMEILGGGTGDFDPEKEREKIRAEEQGKTLEWVKGKLNLREEDVKTLGDVRDSSGDTGIGKFSQIDSLEGEEYEEAVASLSPEEIKEYENYQTTK